MASLLRPHDLLIICTGLLAAFVLATMGRGQPGWERASLVDLGVASSPFLFRGIQHRWSNEVTRFLATFVPGAVGVILIYGELNPLCSLVGSRLADADLLGIDRQIFGTSPAFWLSGRLPGWLLGILSCCYPTYYIWPLAIGWVLFRRGPGDTGDLDRFSLGYVLFMISSFAGYLVFPAIGPRFYLAHEFTAPLTGSVALFWDRAFKGAPFFRDCFPSGHAGLTLFCLYAAQRHAPRLFRAMVIPCLCLIVATVACRFHYGIDLIAGAALSAGVIVATGPLYRLISRLSVEPTERRWSAGEPTFTDGPRFKGSAGYPSPGHGFEPAHVRKR